MLTFHQFLESKYTMLAEINTLFKSILKKLGLSNDDIYWSLSGDDVTLELRSDSGTDGHYQHILSAVWPKEDTTSQPKFLVWALGRDKKVEKYLPKGYTKTKEASSGGKVDIWSPPTNGDK